MNPNDPDSPQRSAQPSLGTSGAPDAQVRASAGRILVVDDEPNVRLTVAQMLRIFGYEVAEAASGAAALALVRSTEFDLVVSDIRMPGMDGYETFRAIRALRPGIRGVAMTGFADDASPRTAQDAGFVRLVRKPFTFKTLLEAIEATLDPNRDTSR